MHPPRDTEKHTYTHSLILTVCIFSSLPLFFSQHEWGHGGWQPMCATTQHEKVQCSDTHTNSCLRVCHHGWQVGSGWTQLWRFQSHHRKKHYLTLCKVCVYVRVYMCVSQSQLAKSSAALGRQSGITVCHQGGTWPLTPCRHGHRCVVTSQEAGGGGLARRLLLWIAATCFHHLLFTLPPSLHPSLLLRPTQWGPTALVPPPFISTFSWVGQVWRHKRKGAVT